MARMETTGCALCGSKTNAPLFTASDPNLDKSPENSFTVVKCRSCGLVFVNPRPSYESLPEFYGAEYYGTEGKRFNPLMEFFIRRFRAARAGEVLKIKPRGSVLDIGCGRGHMLSLLKEKGWDAVGTELSGESAAFARDSLGLRIEVGRMEELAFEAKSFDVVTLWHVFEHLPHPEKTLRKIRDVLRDDGELLISVPNFASLQARISGPRWFHLDVPRHLYQFTPDTLAALLEKNGFRVKSIKYTSLEYSYFGMVQSIYNAIGIKENCLYDMLRRKNARLKKGGYGTAGVLTVLLSPIIFPLGLITSFFADFTRYGGNILVRAAKN